MTTSNIRDFEIAIDKFKKEVGEEVLFVSKFVTTSVFRYLTDCSPAPDRKPKGRSKRPDYSLGSYMLSHRLGINGPSREPYTIVSKMHRKKINYARRTAHLKQLKAKLPQAKVHDKFVITNEVPHNFNVEWGTGWPRAEGYYPFTRTKQYFSRYLPSIVRRAQRKYRENRL